MSRRGSRPADPGSEELAPGDGPESLPPAGPGVRIASILIWVLWLAATALWTLVVGGVYLLTAWWDRRRWYAGRTFRLGARILLFLNPFWRVRIVGAPPSDDLYPFVAVSNHESLADILIIGTIPWDMKWLSKVEIFRIPFLGWMMRMAGDVPVHRSSASGRVEAYGRLRSWMDRGASVMIFPEGTRSRTSELLRFQNGAFRLALETGRPLLPIAVSGTREAIRKGNPWFGRADVVVRILDPVPVQDLGPEALEKLRDGLRARIDEARRRPEA
ncbi:MAG: 1-acyl-sn-glycerol-3-phosphate acyltransferase [Gemmatimonadota bacterium]